jgi:hypothetical protein
MIAFKCPEEWYGIRPLVDDYCVRQYRDTMDARRWIVDPDKFPNVVVFYFNEEGWKIVEGYGGSISLCDEQIPIAFDALGVATHWYRYKHPYISFDDSLTDAAAVFKLTYM